MSKEEEGGGTMLYDNKYCCLGVGCAVLKVPKSQIKEYGFPFQSTSSKIPNYFDNSTESVEEWQDMLSAMNDGSGKWYDKRRSFLQIANWIEKNI